MKSISQLIGELTRTLSSISQLGFELTTVSQELSSRLATLRAAIATVNAAGVRPEGQAEDQDHA